MLGIVTLLFIAIGAAACVWYLRLLKTARAEKQKIAEAQRARHGGESVLEWPGPYAEGEPDGEFGRLVVVIPKKRGDGGARFYEKGLALDKKRIPYLEIKDIFYSAPKKGIKLSLKQAVQDRGYMWIYRKKGRTVGIGGFTYRLDDEVMQKIQKGLGFAEGIL